MAYRVLALKWRPAGFQQVVAQEHVTKTLQNAIQSGRIANAYLFAGPRGVGKTTTARIFAKALNCKNGPTPEPCNECSNCKEIAAGISFDVQEIDGASNRGIDEIRNLRENIRFSPSTSKFKIYIVDEVHMLTTEAFNALLKTLEEPPSHVRFIFATTEPHRVPATILSRCQRFDFKRIPIDQIISQLKLICEKEGIETGEEALLIVAKRADGSLRDAESLLDQLVSFCGTKITVQDVLKAFSVVGQELYFELTDILKTRDSARALEFANQLISSGYDINEFLLGLVEHFRNLLLAKSIQDSRFLEVAEDYKQRFVEESENFSTEDLLRMIQITADSEYKIKQAPNPRIRLELCILSLVKMSTSVTLSQVIGELKDLHSQASAEKLDIMSSGEAKSLHSQTSSSISEPKGLGDFGQKKTLEIQEAESGHQIEESSRSEQGPSDFSSATPESKDEEVNLELFITLWPRLIQTVQKRRLFVSIFLKEGRPLRFDGNTLQIGFPAENGFHLEAAQKNREVILQAIQEVFGITVRLEFVKAQFEKGESDTEIVESLSTHHKDKSRNKKIDPKVLRIVKEFDGKIITYGG